MFERRRFLSDISWFQVIASALAAVVAAWIASSLGVAGTLIGAALGSFVVTLSTAFFANTLHQGRTLLIQTERGTVIERQVEDGEVSDAFSEATDVDSPVVGARFVEDKPKLRWKVVLATSLIVLLLANAVILGYELIAGHPIGDSGGGTSIGDTFGSGQADEPAGTTPTDDTTTPATTTTTATTSEPTATATTTTSTTESSATPTLPSSPTTEPRPE